MKEARKDQLLFRKEGARFKKERLTINKELSDLGVQSPNRAATKGLWEKWREASKTKANELKQLRAEKTDLERQLRSAATTEDKIKITTAIKDVNSRISQNVSFLQKSLKATALPAAATVVLANRITEHFDIENINPNWEKEVFGDESAPGSSDNPSGNTEKTTETRTRYLEKSVQIDISRKSESLRSSVSQKGITLAGWTNIMGRLAPMNERPGINEKFMEIKAQIEAVNADPSIEKVRILQAMVDMENIDAAHGRDGMLGKRTIKAVDKYLDDLLNGKVPPETSADAPTENASSTEGTETKDTAEGVEHGENTSENEQQVANATPEQPTVSAAATETASQAPETDTPPEQQAENPDTSSESAV